MLAAYKDYHICCQSDIRWLRDYFDAYIWCATIGYDLSGWQNNVLVSWREYEASFPNTPIVITATPLAFAIGVL